MSDVIITVRGEHDTEVPAELAIVTVSVRLDDDDRTRLLAAVNASASDLADAVRDAVAAESATRWSSDGTSVWSDRPWNQDGQQLPLVHHASSTLRAEFTDFGALSTWLADITVRDGVTVDGVSWELRPETARATEATVAQSAVGVAVSRARAYAEALGLSSVQAIEVADAGLLDTGPSESFAPKMARAMSADSGGAGGVTLEPRPLRVAVTVEARFTAR